MSRAGLARQIVVGGRMTLSALDTSFEAELRALIFLFILDEPANVDYLACLDTLTVNAHTFGLGETNVNGTHRLASGELNARTHLMTEALQRMTLQGLVHFTRKDGRESFHISNEGTALVTRLSTHYAANFFSAALETIERVGDKDTNALTSIILATATPGESR